MPIISRRSVLRSGGAVAASSVLSAPFIRNAAAATLELRWLGWEHYNVPEIVEPFEQEHGVRISSSYIDGNAEAYNRLRLGGTDEFDLVMGDGFWPQLYAEQGLIQPLNYDRIPNIENVFPSFLPPIYTVMQSRDGRQIIASPNCWGGYGITSNLNHIDSEDAQSLALLFNGKYGRKLSTAARPEENIALAAILAAEQMGTKDRERPNGQSFSPYVLFDDELEAARDLLIRQKPLLVTRWTNEDALEQLLRAEAVWASPEWSSIYRRIYFNYLDGETDLNMQHTLRPREGGLGWVDTWAITSGVTDSEREELCYKWMDWRIKPENMVTLALTGKSPTVDVRDALPPRYVEALFLDQTEVMRDLYQYDAPDSPEKWERIWSQVEAA